MPCSCVCLVRLQLLSFAGCVPGRRLPSRDECENSGTVSGLINSEPLL
jgi:hypothetical protein